MLLRIPQVLSAETVQTIRARLQSEAWQDGSSTAGGIARTVKHNQQIQPGIPCHTELANVVLTAISQNPLFVSSVLPKKIFTPNFNRYQGGDSYGAHIDGSLLQTGSGQDMLRTDVSSTLFLSDPDEYTGGELLIETQYGSQEIKLAAGDMVVYPATSLHRVAPVESGARIASFFWTQSLIRDNGQREQLFELDQSIQSLTKELGGQHREVTRLSGIYHNLVRQWAET